MSYPVEVRLADKKGWHTPGEASAFYGRYGRVGITVHWWDTPQRAGTHDGTVNYILNKAKAGTGSVNYVLSNDKITLLVEPENVAWASQSGNPTTVSIEFDPRLNGEGYRKAGWLINELEKRFKRTLTLYPHNHWFATQCPGTLDLNRMRREADIWKNVTESLPMNSEAGKELYRAALHREAESDAAASQWNGVAPSAAMQRLRQQPEWKVVNSKVKGYDALAAQVAALSARPTKEELQKVIDELKARDGKIADLEKKITEHQPSEAETTLTKFFSLIKKLWSRS